MTDGGTNKPGDAISPSFFASKVNAAPFVPGSSPNSTNVTVSASPSGAAPGSPASTSPSSSTLKGSAAPFVPAGKQPESTSKKGQVASPSNPSSTASTPVSNSKGSQSSKGPAKQHGRQSPAAFSFSPQSQPFIPTGPQSKAPAPSPPAPGGSPSAKASTAPSKPAATSAPYIPAKSPVSPPYSAIMPFDHVARVSSPMGMPRPGMHSPIPPVGGRGPFMPGRGGRGMPNMDPNGRISPMMGRGRGGFMPTGPPIPVPMMLAPAMAPVPIPAATISAPITQIPKQRAHEQFVLAPGRAKMASKFLNETLRQQLQHNNYLTQLQWTSTHQGEEAAVPDKIGPYHTLYPLEDAASQADAPSHVLGVSSTLYKAISSKDGQAYVLRRFDPKQVVPSADLLSQFKASLDSWARLSNHPNLVGFRDSFVSSELGGTPAVFLAYDYHPGAISLAQAHILPVPGPGGLMAPSSPSEEQLWSWLVQLTSLLRAVHSAGLALGPQSLHPSKVLNSGFGRIRVSCVGLAEGLSGELVSEREDLPFLQRQDLSAVGQLMLALACAGFGPAPHLDVMAMNYSAELVGLTAGLLAAADGSGLGSWRQLTAALAERTLVEAETAAMTNDNLLNELAKECENGRLLRLLVKLGYINERPGTDVDTQWSETGDRYLLKLFRDFVFHQTSEEGGPLLDWGHVVEALNKLDAGVPEQVLLMSRDEQSMLVASYGDLKRCMEGAYSDLRMQASAAKTRSRTDRH